uniref:BZIP domain-containing protein n=1 Tax=Meloidogyne incognita TaxID=6306 RepID=A0A914LMA8_MELIC
MLVTKTDDQNNNINNSIDCSQSVISTSEGMTSSEVVANTPSDNLSTFQSNHQPQIQNNKSTSPMLFSASKSASSLTSTSSASFSSSSSHSTSTSLNDLNDKQQNGSNYRDRTHLKLELKDLKPREFLGGNNSGNNNNGISPMSLPLSLLDSASLLLSPDKILLAARQQQQQPLLGNRSSQTIQNTQNLLQQKLETPTPSTILFPKNVTSEQEKFAEGWQKVLQEFQGRDTTSLPSLQATSPSAVKLLLSLALTPSPFSANKANNSSLLQAAASTVNNAVGATAVTTDLNSNIVNAVSSTITTPTKQFDLPKILLNQQQQNQTVVSGTVNTSQSNSVNSITKRYMEYFQLGQAVAAVSATSPTSSVELIPNSSFFHQHQRPSSVSTSLQPLLATPTTPTSNGVQTFAHNTAFIKREPNTSSICEEQMDILVDTQTSNLNGSASSNHDSHRRSSSISSASSPRVNGKVQVVPNGNSINGYDGVISEHDMKKLLRKRERNREAASKCRQRKLQRIADLEQQVEDERKRERELEAEIARLQGVIKNLQEKLTGYH